MGNSNGNDSFYSNNVQFSEIVQRRYDDDSISDDEANSNEIEAHYKQHHINDKFNQPLQEEQYLPSTQQIKLPSQNNNLLPKSTTLPEQHSTKCAHKKNKNFCTYCQEERNITRYNCPRHGKFELENQFNPKHPQLECNCPLGHESNPRFPHKTRNLYNPYQRELSNNTENFRQRSFNQSIINSDIETKTSTYQIKLNPPPHYITKYNITNKLHHSTITAICPFAPNPRDIAYASAGLDKTIKLWSVNFDMIDLIQLTSFPSIQLSHYRTKRLLSAEGLYLKVYDVIGSLMLKHILRDHSDDILTLLILSDNLTIATGGKDKVIRIWDVKKEKCLNYFKGHQHSIKKLEHMNKKENIISVGEDKAFIVWNIQTGEQLAVYNNYFSSTDVIGTEFGFICGSYDNKIRLFNNNYKLFGVLYGNFYGTDNFLMVSKKELMFINEKNEMCIVDITSKKMKYVYDGIKGDIVKVIKGCDWESEKCLENGCNGEKVVIVATEDGFVYEYQVYPDVQKPFYIDNY